MFPSLFRSISVEQSKEKGDRERLELVILKTSSKHIYLHCTSDLQFFRKL